MVIGPPDHINLNLTGFIGLIGPTSAEYQARFEKVPKKITAATR